MTKSSCTLAFAEDSWRSLVKELDAGVETAWVLLARVVGDPNHGLTTLLVYKVVNVPEDAYDVRRGDRLSIRTSGWLPAFGQADSDETVPIFVHTHPRMDPRHSKYDLEVDDELARVAHVRTKLGHYGSLVIGGKAESPTFAGRFKVDRGDWTSVDRIRIVGERLMLLMAGSTLDQASRIFDRQVLAFGEHGQALLRNLRVGVVGAGGTGSSVVEQLVRLGVGQLVIVDPETLTDTNVTRVYGSTLRDVDRPKIDIASDHSRSIGLGTSVSKKQGRVLDRGVVAELLHCDIIMGCTDDNAGRIVLTRMPQALLQILVDCGVVIDSRGGQLFDIFGRVSIVTPVSACLVCMGDIDAQRAAAEAMTDDERQARIREGYAPELDTADPSVITYTTITAGFAVNEVLSRTLGYTDDEPANRILLRIGSRAISKSRREPQGTHRCTKADLLGVGTREPFLDYGWRDA